MRQHTCNSTAPFKASNAAAQAHAREGTSACRRAHIEASMDRYLRLYGSLEGYKYKGAGWHKGYDCDSEAPLEANSAHMSWHRKRKTEVCRRAYEEMAMYRYHRKYGTLEGYKYKDRSVLFDKTTRVYMLTFEDGACYYGVTSWSVESRVAEHARHESKVGAKLRTGIAYKVETLCIAPTRRQAEELELLCIKSGNPFGELLNVRDAGR